MKSSKRIWLTGSTAVTPVLEKILIDGEYDVKVTDAARLQSASWADLPSLLILAEEPSRLARLLIHLRSHPPWRDLAIVAALIRFDDSVAAETVGLGADEFLIPPYQPQEVLARVMVVLRLHRQRRLLPSCPIESVRVFDEYHRPVFICDHQGDHCLLNPALERLLGYSSGKGEKPDEINALLYAFKAADLVHPGKPQAKPPETVKTLLYEDEDHERFRRMIQFCDIPQRVKVRLKSREGEPLTVLLSHLPHQTLGTERLLFEILPVGSSSALKRAFHSLVENIFPVALDYLQLLEMTPLLGGRYEKIRKIGQGSFAEVWLIKDTEALEGPQEYVAKIPFSRTANSNFRWEAKIGRRLSPHPGVVKQIDVLEDDKKAILVQEYLSGKTLEDMLAGTIPLSLLEHLILQLIDVVAHAHQHRIIHRDIKPCNIMVLSDGTLKLLDFGAAKILKDKDFGATMVGSRPYMAPEQLLGKSEIRSDIWAIGVIMYLLYTGELPFYSEADELLINQILEKEPTAPRQLKPNMSPTLEEIVLKCLEKDVEKRYPSAVALEADLLQQFPGYGGQTA